MRPDALIIQLQSFRVVVPTMDSGPGGIVGV